MAMKKGIIIDTTRLTIIRECMYDDSKRIEGLYYDTIANNKHDMIPIAYVFPIENEVEVQLQLNKLKQAKKEHDDIVANIYYTVFPTLR